MPLVVYKREVERGRKLRWRRARGTGLPAKHTWYACLDERISGALRACFRAWDAACYRSCFWDPRGPVVTAMRALVLVVELEVVVVRVAVVVAVV